MVTNGSPYDPDTSDIAAHGTRLVKLVVKSRLCFEEYCHKGSFLRPRCRFV